ncbi:MmgE/PrpD family protein [Cupriavidus sp. IK-TO18]|uniref:MmgE/PrpD family protein n=1 Tax=Cupriavidus sp. IK-TO18 TaxID=2782182 RepID=UPI0018973B48|nr:MmgE/PrpD family protein [Cupriavidus sp. IK-TO18]MBF6988069.1 MmgE/PrpD family protein [Cupriavidus sp. IK-TO18]
MPDDHPGAALARFAAGLRYEAIPQPVVATVKSLFLDWIGCSLAGKGHRAIRMLESFAERMGPTDGTSELLISRRRTSPFFAALVNAAASNVVEQTDVHNGAVLHAGAVVFPAVLAAAQDAGSPGYEIIAAAVAGYEVGVRVAEYLGRSHYRIFHTTATVGTLAAAVAVGRLLRLDSQRMLAALGSAGTQAAGLWEFLGDGADSRQLHIGKAAADGLLSAYLALDGFTAATRILDGRQGLAAAMSNDADAARLLDRLGTRWTTAETSLKWHASCRHAHPAADALLALMRAEGLQAGQIRHVTAGVHQAALDVLHDGVGEETVDQAMFSITTVLALIAIHGRAGTEELYGAMRTAPEVEAFRTRVSMKLDNEVDAAYPQRWIGKVRVVTADGRELESVVRMPKGDPANPLTDEEIEQKLLRLARFAGGASPDEIAVLIQQVRNMENWSRTPRMLS